jgi:fused signal recognition particle receptor
MALAIRRELGLPIQYVGLGERAEDLAPFDADAFVSALFPESDADDAA